MPRVSPSDGTGGGGGGGGGVGTKRVRAEGEEAEAEALDCLTTVSLKLAAVLYAAIDGGELENVPREDLLAPLEAIGCDNPTNATQLNRVVNNPVAHWFVHNKERGSEARIGLTKDGVEAIHELFTDDDDGFDQDALDALTRAITKVVVAPDAAVPLSQRKLPRAAPAPAAAEAEDDAVALCQSAEIAVQKLVAHVSIRELQQRVDVLAKRFDDKVNKDDLAAVYGDLAANFLKTNSRVPTSREGDALLRVAQGTIFGQMQLGNGKVKHTELCDVLTKLEVVSKLVAEVMDLEERAAE
jgi:hypothetical protein